MPKALNRSATTVSRLQRSVTATDMGGSSSSEDEESGQDTPERPALDQSCAPPSPVLSMLPVGAASHTTELSTAEHALSAPVIVDAAPGVKEATKTGLSDKAEDLHLR